MQCLSVMHTCDACYVCDECDECDVCDVCDVCKYVFMHTCMKACNVM